MQIRFLDAVKAFEGFAEKSSWDYAQHTNGFGTKALYAGEKISLEEANKRFLAEIGEARRFVETQAQGWDEGTKAALTSLTFNTGTRWASSGLGDAVRSHDIDAVRSRFLEYTKAGGEVLPGLVKRRLAEVTWIGDGIPSLQKSSSQAPIAADPLSDPATTESASATTLSETSAAHTMSVYPAEATAEPLQSEQTRTSDIASAQRASSVAWMLLALDMGAFNPRLADDRGRRDGP